MKNDTLTGTVHLRVFGAGSAQETTLPALKVDGVPEKWIWLRRAGEPAGVDAPLRALEGQRIQGHGRLLLANTFLMDAWTVL